MSGVLLLNRMSTNEQPAVSVIIPAYKDAIRLSRTLLRLKEIREREYPNLEVIVSVQPYPGDGTETVARSYADAVVLSNGGVSRQRNTGAEASRGAVLVFLDADALPSFATIPAIAAATGRDTIGTCTAYPNRDGIRACLSIWLQNFVRGLHLVKGVSNLLFCHRSIFFERGVRYDPNLNVGEHFDFYRRAVKEGKAHYRYLRIPNGFEVDVGRYERVGYVRTFIFWLIFTAYRYLVGSSIEIEKLYWERDGRVGLSDLVRLYKAGKQALRLRAQEGKQ